MARSRKPLLLYGLPRSGSTLFYKILEGYLAQVEGLIGLKEYFGLGKHSYWDAGDHIAQTYYPSEIDWLAGLRESTGARTAMTMILWQRTEWFKKHYPKHFIKLGVPQNLATDEEWLRRTHEWVFVERRNLFENLLSFLISHKLRKWYEEGGLKVRERSMTAQQDEVRLFESFHGQYVERKKLHKPKAVLVYEEFLENPDPVFHLRKIGLDKPFDSSRLILTEKQNDYSKLDRFTNPDALYDWYRASSLQRYFAV